MAGIISNGTYVLGANIGEVSVDSSLTGKGTPDSPLGLNETVLWEGTPTAKCTCTEDPRNFEEIKLYNSASNSTYSAIGNQTVMVSMQPHYTGFEILLPSVSTGNYSLVVQQWSVGSTGITINKQHTLVSPWSSTSTAMTHQTSLVPSIVKIIGINRTANN